MLGNYLTRYIYLPMLSTLPSTLMGRLCASAVCFSFVYVWHGKTGWWVVLTSVQHLSQAHRTWSFSGAVSIS